MHAYIYILAVAVGEEPTRDSTPVSILHSDILTIHTIVHTLTTHNIVQYTLTIHNIHNHNT